MLLFRRSVYGPILRSPATTVTAHVITKSLHTNRIETLTGRLVNHEDASFVVASDRPVRIARGHA